MGAKKMLRESALSYAYAAFDAFLRSRPAMFNQPAHYLSSIASLGKKIELLLASGVSNHSPGWLIYADANNTILWKVGFKCIVNEILQVLNLSGS